MKLSLPIFVLLLAFANAVEETAKRRTSSLRRLHSEENHASSDHATTTTTTTTAVDADTIEVMQGIENFLQAVMKDLVQDNQKTMDGETSLVGSALSLSEDTVVVVDSDTPPATDASSAAPVFDSIILTSDAPSLVPSDAPSMIPSDAPSMVPSDAPSVIPSDAPSMVPSEAPSFVPSDGPSMIPIEAPSFVPSDGPSRVPIETPLSIPSDGPFMVPSETSSSSSSVPNVAPTPGPTVTTTILPSVAPLSILIEAPTTADRDIVAMTAPPVGVVGDEATLDTSDTSSSIPSDLPSLVPKEVSTPAPTPYPSLRPTTAPQQTRPAPPTAPVTMSVLFCEDIHSCSRPGFLFSSPRSGYKMSQSVRQNDGTMDCISECVLPGLVAARKAIGWSCGNGGCAP